MDGSRFDALVRLLARPVGRRRLLVGLGALIGGAAVPMARPARAQDCSLQAGQGCQTDEDCTTICSTLACCSGTCADTPTDPQNCGGCGYACESGGYCDGGRCGTLACPSGTIFCEGSCVDVNNDSTNCGYCGTACDSGATCCHAICADTNNDQVNCGACDALCVPGQACCAGVCTDVTTDAGHCGACDAACAADETCSNGHCLGGCSAGQALCKGVCVDTGVDPNNCGTCGIVCTAGQACQGGACQAEAVASPTPVSRRIVPDPAECVAAPRAREVVERLAKAIPAEVTPPISSTAANAPAADEGAVDQIRAVVRQIVACVNAGDVSRWSALFTESALPAALAAHGWTGNVLASLLDTAPSPLPAPARCALDAVADVRLPGANEATARVSIEEPMRYGHPTGSFLGFSRVGDAWLVDGSEPLAAP